MGFVFLLFLIKVASDHAHSSPGPQPLVPVLSKGKLLNNNIFSFKASNWKILKYWTDC